MRDLSDSPEKLGLALKIPGVRILADEGVSGLSADERALHQRAHGIGDLEACFRRNAPAQTSAEYQPIELPATATIS